jgi:SAM-dependent methyltransferase
METFIPSNDNSYFNSAQAKVYNYLVGSYTKLLYADFFKNIPDNSRVLDIGVGNGSSLVENAKLIIKKNIKIVGIDIDPGAIDMAHIEIKENNIEGNVRVLCGDIYKYVDFERFDYIYFSNSFAVIEGITEMIKDVKTRLLRETGQIGISTTIESKPNNIKSLIKKNAKKMVLGIDFGKLTTICEFVNDMSENDLTIKNMKLVYEVWYPIWGNIHIYTFLIE